MSNATQLSVSDVLREAADVYLAKPNSGDCNEGAASKQLYSCMAINAVLVKHKIGDDTSSYNLWSNHPFCQEIKNFLKSLGCRTGEYSAFQWTNESTETRQGTRYAWLHFAADLWDEGFRP